MALLSRDLKRETKFGDLRKSKRVLVYNIFYRNKDS